MSIVEQDELIKTLSNEQLQNYANSPDGTLPLYLVVAQLKRNEDTRSRFSALQAEQQTSQQPRTVVERLAPPRPGEIPVPSSRVAANPAPQIPLQQVGAPAPMPTVNAQEGLDFEKLMEAYAKVAAAEEKEKVDMTRPDHFGSGRGGSFEEGGETPTSRYPSNVMAALRKAIAEEERGGVKGGFRTRAPYQPERKKGRFTPAARHGRELTDKDFYTWNPLSTAMRYQDGLGGLSKRGRGRTVNAQDGYNPDEIDDLTGLQRLFGQRMNKVRAYEQGTESGAPGAAENLAREREKLVPLLNKMASLEVKHGGAPAVYSGNLQTEAMRRAELDPQFYGQGEGFTAFMGDLPRPDETRAASPLTEEDIGSLMAEAGQPTDPDRLAKWQTVMKAMDDGAETGVETAPITGVETVPRERPRRQVRRPLIQPPAVLKAEQSALEAADAAETVVETPPVSSSPGFVPAHQRLRWDFLGGNEGIQTRAELLGGEVKTDQAAVAAPSQAELSGALSGWGLADPLREPDLPSVMEKFEELRGKTPDNLKGGEDKSKLSKSEILSLRNRWGSRISGLKKNLPGGFERRLPRALDRIGSFYAGDEEDRSRIAAEAEFAASQSDYIKNMSRSVMMEQLGAPEWIVKEERNKEAKLAAVAPDETAKGGLTTGALAAEKTAAEVTPAGDKPKTVETVIETPEVALYTGETPNFNTVVQNQRASAKDAVGITNAEVRDARIKAEAARVTLENMKNTAIRDDPKFVEIMKDRKKANAAAEKVLRDIVSDTAKTQTDFIKRLEGRQDAIDTFTKTGKLPPGRRDKLMNKLLLLFGSSLLGNANLADALSAGFAGSIDVIKGEQDSYAEGLTKSLEAEKAIGDLRVKAADTKGRMNMELTKMIRAAQTGNEALAQQIEGNLLNRRKLEVLGNKAIMEHGVQLHTAQTQRLAALKSNASTRKDRIEQEYYKETWIAFKNAYDGATDAGKRKALNKYKDFFNYMPGENMLDPSQPKRKGFQKIFNLDPELRTAATELSAWKTQNAVSVAAQNVIKDVNKEIDAIKFQTGIGFVKDPIMQAMMKKAGITPDKKDRKTVENLKRDHPDLLRAFFIQKHQQFQDPIIRTRLLNQYGQYFVTEGGAPAATVARSLEQLRQNKK